MMQRTVSINDVDLLVEYTRSEYLPDSFDTPAEGGDVEIQAVAIDGNNVTGLLADWVTERIADALAFYLHDDLQQEKQLADEDRAERLYEGQGQWIAANALQRIANANPAEVA